MWYHSYFNANSYVNLWTQLYLSENFILKIIKVILILIVFICIHTGFHSWIWWHNLQQRAGIENLFRKSANPCHYLSLRRIFEIYILSFDQNLICFFFFFLIVALLQTTTRNVIKIDLFVLTETDFKDVKCKQGVRQV